MNTVILAAGRFVYALINTCMFTLSSFSAGQMIFIRLALRFISLQLVFVSGVEAFEASGANVLSKINGAIILQAFLCFVDC